MGCDSRSMLWFIVWTVNGRRVRRLLTNGGEYATLTYKGLAGIQAPWSVQMTLKTAERTALRSLKSLNGFVYGPDSCVGDTKLMSW